MALKYRYRCYLCQQIVYLPYNVHSVRYYCEVKECYTKLYRTNK